MGIGLTTDAWTSCVTEHYIAYTAHFIDKNWELKNKVLSTQCTEEKQTSENIAADMMKTEHRWGLDTFVSSSVCA